MNQLNFQPQPQYQHVLFFSNSRRLDDLVAAQVNNPFWCRSLSNFSLIDEFILPLDFLSESFPKDQLKLDALLSQLPVSPKSLQFDSVEHAFHFVKVALASDHPEHAIILSRSTSCTANMSWLYGTQINGAHLGASVDDYVPVTPAEAKKYGSRGGFKQRGTVFNSDKWTRQFALAVTECLISYRLQQDIHFCDILQACADNNVRLIHFEKSQDLPYWGATPNYSNDVKRRTKYYGEHILSVRGMNVLGVLFNKIIDNKKR